MVGIGGQYEPIPPDIHPTFSDAIFCTRLLPPLRSPSSPRRNAPDRNQGWEVQALHQVD